MPRPDDPILDERVARRKYAAAERLYGARELFRLRGWQILEPQFPNLGIDFLGVDGSVRAGVRLGLRNYDFLPPSVTFVDPTGKTYDEQRLGLLLRRVEDSHVPPALRNGFMLVASTGGYLPGSHPFTLLPFLCVRGTWEYHSHPQHAEILWEWIRTESGYGLQYVIDQARSVFRPEVFN